MNKRQYLESLREYLSFELPDRLVEKNLVFYTEYFEAQIREGKTAQEVCDELGDPQLIAKSCIEAEKAGSDGIPDSQDDNTFEKEMYAESGKQSGRRSFFGQDNTDDGTNQQEDQQPKVFQGAGCLLTMLILLGLVCLIIAFFSTSVGSVVLTFLILIGLFKMITKLFRG